ncbi:phage terminase large subunit family protein [Hungatella sp. L12]|uniref:Phage terminase large subunit family protein n=1 Tax=Hungatella hominis TaxID=2763050 RepID=A0ABR7HGZ3_9FIRM|nr:terminase gpA endonuclease subunit [Hungatella hominis]MBC5712407.1 phage terminase large subunit family protein [Hungatella hominis]
MSQRSRSRIKTKRLFQRIIKKILQKPETLTVSQWAEKYRILDDNSNIKGHWSNAITPYLVEIMDSINDSDIRMTFFCKASQIGGTSALINMLCYIIAESPAPTMIVYPSDDLAKDISNDSLKPVFRMVPEIRKIFMENSSKELRLKFKTMVLYLRGAGSPSKLASKPIKYLFFDEIDKMGGASKKEASPYNLALERTKTYKPQEKVFACSTPTLKTNYIWDLHENADEVKHYFIVCPHCGEEIELVFKQIFFDKDEDHRMSVAERAATAVYVCQKCGCEITDGEKPRLLREGRWKVIKKRGVGKAKTVGYWISSLYSIFLKWSDIVEEFLKSKDDPDKLQNFVNSWLGEAWEDTKLKTTEDTVLERQTTLPEFVIPAWAELLTAGVDVQETSLYYTIRAFGKFTTSQNITHGQVLSFSEIEQVMNSEWDTEDGRKLIVNLALIDSGYQPDATYDFCIDNSEWAAPCKGASNPMRDRYKISKVDKTDSKAYGMQLVIIDGDQYKDSIASRMKRENGTGSWMVYNGCDSEYAKQVTSEHKIMEKSANGTRKMKWVVKHSHADNHYLDCEVYAMAAAEIRGVRSLHLRDSGTDDIAPKKEGNYNPEENWIQKQDDWLTGG